MQKLLRFDKNQKYLVFDTETEGLNLIHSRPWQVSWIICQDGKVLEKFDKLLKWDNLQVSPEAAKITGFNASHYNSNSEDPKEVWELFSSYLYNKDFVIVGQNLLGFDVYMVNVWRQLLGLDSDFSYIDRIIDTKSIETAISKNIPVNKERFISWQYQLLNYREKGLKTSLITLLKKYNIDHDPKRLHDSLYDIQMNYKVFCKQLYQIDL